MTQEKKESDNSQPIECPQPDKLLEGITEEEFMAHARKGYSYAMNELDPNLKLKKGMIIDIAGERLQLKTNGEEVLEAFDLAAIDDLKAAIIAMCAKIGISSSYISLYNKGLLQRVNNEGKPLNKNKADRDVKRESKIVEATAILIRELMKRRGKELDLEKSGD